MSDYDLHQVEEIAEESSYSKGAVIIEENTPADRFFIIHKGKIEIAKELEGGEELVLGVHSDGEFFGEMALLDEGLRSASARALESTTVFAISRQNFETLLYKAPILAYSIMKELSSRLRETGALLVSHLLHKNRQLNAAFLDTVMMVVQAVESRNVYTRWHTQRVTGVSKAIGREMGLIEEEMFMLEIGALLHDLGKMENYDTIYMKAGPLNPEEYEFIKKHTVKGKELMESIPYLEQAIPPVLYHHERFDGKGYPNHLSGGHIPLPGRIIALADAFDAMTSDRSYRKRVSPEEAIEEIKRCSGTQFDPQVVEAFLRVWESKKLIDINGRKSYNSRQTKNQGKQRESGKIRPDSP